MLKANIPTLYSVAFNTCESKICSNSIKDKGEMDFIFKGPRHGVHGS